MLIESFRWTPSLLLAAKLFFIFLVVRRDPAIPAQEVSERVQSAVTVGAGVGAGVGGARGEAEELPGRATIIKQTTD